MAECSYIWGQTSINWNSSDWTWGEIGLICDTISNFCNFVWGTTESNWISTDWTWGEIELACDIADGWNLGIDVRESEPWNPYKNYSDEKKKKLIEIVCKVREKEYKKKIEVGKKITITANDIRLTMKHVLGVKLKDE